MSATLRKRNHWSEHPAQSRILTAGLQPAGVLILFLLFLMAVLGHFFPAG